MSELPPNHRSDGDDGAGFDRESPTGTPRWIYLFGFISIVLGMLFVSLHSTGSGSCCHTLPSSVTVQGGQQR